MMQKFNMMMPTALRERLQVLQARTGLKLSDLVRRAIEEYLTREGVC